MRKKLIAAVTLTALLVTVLGAAMAAPGTKEDPFVTLSYLTDTYYPQVQADALARIQEATAPAGQAALDKLDSLAGSYLARAGGRSYTDGVLRLTLFRNDRLDLPTGSSLQFESGEVDLVFGSGMLIDVTDGTTVSAGGKLTKGHRYVAAENTAVSVTAVSDAAYLSVRGYYNLESTGEVQTPFTDLKKDDWYYPYVRYAYDNELFNGVSATVFSPNTNMNRAMLATVLCRLAEADTDVTPAGFTDVASNAWYADTVNWAAYAGIVTGYTNEIFAPNADVTRAQMAVMLHRYAGNYLGMDVSCSGDLSSFHDSDKVPGWARDAVSWAVDNGLITGYTNGNLGPDDPANRAQVAAILQRFSNLI